MITGIDVSAYQEPAAIDWVKLFDEGIKYTIIKAAEGIGDEKYKAELHANAAASADMMVGYYAFLRPRLPKYEAEKAEGTDVRASARAQAKQFLRNLEGLPPATFGIWADMEVVDPDKKLTAQQLTDFLSEFCSYCDENSPYMVGIYAGAYFLRDNLTPKCMSKAGLQKYPLWIPWYGVESPQWIPEPWTQYAIHQWTDAGTFEGYPKRLDVNRAYPEFVRDVIKNLPGISELPEWVRDFLANTIKE